MPPLQPLAPPVIGPAVGPVAHALPGAAPDLRAPGMVSAPGVPGTPAPALAARFDALMRPPAGPAAVAPAVSAPPSSSKTLGDQVLAGMQRLSAEFESGWRAVSDSVGSGAGLSAQEVLRAQLHVTRLAVQHELVGKVVSRGAQSVDQLVRLQ